MALCKGMKENTRKETHHNPYVQGVLTRMVPLPINCDYNSTSQMVKENTFLNIQERGAIVVTCVLNWLYWVAEISFFYFFIHIYFKFS